MQTMARRIRRFVGDFISVIIGAKIEANLDIVTQIPTAVDVRMVG